MGIMAESIDVFSAAHEESVAQSFFKNRMFLPCKRKQIIFYEGHPALGVYWIRRGRVKVYKMGINGKFHILFFAEAGEMLGVECLLAGDEFTFSGEMLEEGQISFIPKEDFIGLLQSNPHFSFHIMDTLAKRVSASHKERAHLAEGSVRERMACILIRLAKQYGSREEQGILINLPLSREDLANMIGTSAGTVMRLLKEFKEEQAILLQGKHIVVHCKEHLDKVAHFY